MVLKKDDDRKDTQSSQYDKILHENMEAALPGLIKNVLKINAMFAEELPDNVQFTKELKTINNYLIVNSS